MAARVRVLRSRRLIQSSDRSMPWGAPAASGAPYSRVGVEASESYFTV